jgi:hypothetical protein
VLISTSDLKAYLEKLPGESIPKSFILKDIASWEAKQQLEMGEPPFSYGIDAEKALVVYCTPKLYKYIEEFNVEKEDSFNIVSIGKLYLEVKKFLQGGKFKRV